MDLSHLSAICMFKGLEMTICICLSLFSCADMGLHVREGVQKHDMHIKLKFYKLKHLRKLVLQ